MALTQANCDQCGKSFLREAGAINRAKRQGLSLYCGRICSGLGRRKWKSDAQKKAEKAEYDREYRHKNRAALEIKKAEYFQRTYDPVQAAEDRKKRMPAHVEYCRRPEYRAWKREYDKKYRAVKEYGEFAECHLIAMEIREECLAQQSDYEIRQEAGTLNKSIGRKRDYERLNRDDPKTSPLGDPQ